MRSALVMLLALSSMGSFAEAQDSLPSSIVQQEVDSSPAVGGPSVLIRNGAAELRVGCAPRDTTQDCLMAVGRAVGPGRSPLCPECDGPLPRISGAPFPADAIVRPYLDAVVQLTSDGRDRCTGTLITPRLVLTAAHCFGVDSANPDDRGLRGGDPACFVEDAAGRRVADGGCGFVLFTHVNGTATAQAAIRHVWVVEGRSADTGAPNGRDLAIAALPIRATPATMAAAPSVPVWFEGDPGGEHWKHAEIVIAGWGATNLVADTCAGTSSAAAPAEHLGVSLGKRLDGNFPIDSRSASGFALGTPMFIANWDLYGNSTGLTLHGDSGGPLFSPDATGTMRIVGVTSGGDCEDHVFGGTLQAIWTRTFNDDNAALIRRVVIAPDGRSRGNDVSRSDGDGDGVSEALLPGSDPWIGELDNCKDVANPDQADRNADGVGDACERCPAGLCAPPPPVPTGCQPESPPRCGYLTLACNKPLPLLDEIFVGRVGAGPGPLVTTYRVVEQLGLISAEYVGEGYAMVVACAREGLQTRCGEAIAVTLPSPTHPDCYSRPPPPPPCREGWVRCNGACKPVAQCDR